MKTEHHLAPFFMLVFALMGIAIAFYDCYAILIPADRSGVPLHRRMQHRRLQSVRGIYGVPLGCFGLVLYRSMLAFAALLAFSPVLRAACVWARFSDTLP